MKSIKLWLDDERDPSNPRIQTLFGSDGDEVWVKTASMAINYLRRGNVEHVSLDHDLGPSAGTGADVAKWIEEQAYHGKLNKISWSVHSLNPEGAKNITRAMKQADKHWDNLHP